MGRKIVLFLLVLFVMSLDAQTPCTYRPLSENSSGVNVPASMFYATDQEYIANLTLKLDHKLSECMLALSFNEPVYGEITFHNLSDVNCMDADAPLRTSSLNAATSFRFNLNDVSWGDELIIRLSLDRPTSTTAKVSNLTPRSCTRAVNSQNTIESPEVLSLGMNNQVFIQSCNAYCPSLHLPIRQSNQALGKKMKWFYLNTESIGFFDLEVVSNTPRRTPIVYIVQPSSSGYHLNAEIASDVTGTSCAKDKIHSFHSDQLIIGVGNIENQPMEFDLELNAYARNDDCIHFMEEALGDTIVVTETSLGSPLEGPYLEGETISFCYDIHSWYPIHHNWIHGVIPEFSDSWQESSFDSINIGCPRVVQLSDSSNVLGEWRWYTQDTLGINENGFKGKGWYFESDRHTWGGEAFTSWGRSIYEMEDSEPLLRYCLDLKTPDTIDCAVPNEIRIEFEVFSDVMSGDYQNTPCHSEPQVWEQVVRCCDEYSSLWVSDTSICDGDSITFSVASMTGELNTSWHIVHNGNWVAAASGNDGGVVPNLIFNSTDSFLLVATGIDQYGQCEDTLNQWIHISERPEIDLPQSLSICPDDPVLLVPIVLNFDLNNVSIQWNKERMERYGYSQSEAALIGTPLESSRQWVTASTEEGCSSTFNTEIVIDAIEPPSLSEPIVFCDQSGRRTTEERPYLNEGDYFLSDTRISPEDHDWSEVESEMRGDSVYHLTATNSSGCQVDFDLPVQKAAFTDTIIQITCGGFKSPPKLHSLIKRAACPATDSVHCFIQNGDCDLSKWTDKSYEVLSSEELHWHKTGIIVYPNPVSSEPLTIESQDDPISSYLIVSEEGLVVYTNDLTPSTNLITLNINMLQAGRYYLLAILESGQMSTTVLIKELR